MTSVAADVVSALASLGGLGGLAAALTALGAVRRQRSSTDRLEAEMVPDHGTSLRDAVDRIEAGMDDLREEHRDLGRRLGHELGEVRRSTDLAHADLTARVRRLADKV